MAQIMGQIVEFRRVPASDLVPNPKNPRLHDDHHRENFRALLEAIGIADDCITRELSYGLLVLIDGSLRQEDADPDVMIPCLVLDVTEVGADKVVHGVQDLRRTLRGSRTCGELADFALRVQPRRSGTLRERRSGVFIMPPISPCVLSAWYVASP